RLVAYVVARGAKPRPADLRSWLSGQLPAAMVPSAFVLLEALPINVNGKLDRLALPQPGWPVAGVDIQTDAGAPRTPIERTLTEIWANLLEVEDIGVSDDFFDLGGHSLLAVRMALEVGRNLGIEIPVAWLAAGGS